MTKNAEIYTNGGTTMVVRDNGNDVKLMNKKRRVLMHRGNASGTWSISLENLEREDSTGSPRLIRQYNGVNDSFAMNYLDKWQHKLGFFG